MRRLSLLALAAICSVAMASAQTAPTKPSQHGLFDGGAFPPQASGIVTHVDLGNTLASYVTQVSLNSTLSAYLTTSAAAKTYLPLSGGTITQGLTVKGQLIGYANFIVMNGFVQQFWPSETGVLGANIWASSSTYGRLQIGDTGGGAGGIITGAATLTTLSGTGNAYACLDASGNLYRSSTACQ